MPEPGALGDSFLERRGANHAPLTPLQFLERAAGTYGDLPAVVHGEWTLTWAEVYTRSRRLGSALQRRFGVRRGDVVATLLTNTPEMLEAHHGVPMAGAVLNTMNTRLDAKTVAFILEHGGARVLLTDGEFAGTVEGALALLPAERRAALRVVDVMDRTLPPAERGRAVGDVGYDALLEGGDPDFAWVWPRDEWDAIALNYTSGTTGNPKGTVLHHRGAHLNATSNVLAWGLHGHIRYLWTLPMFHCNGWCYPWTLSLLAGTHICLRKVTAAAIYGAIARHRVTHMCGAPIIMETLLGASDADRAPFSHKVEMCTAAAPPPPPVLERMGSIGFRITHVYGLTEVYGPAVVCSWRDAWDDLEIKEQARLKSRQGVRYHMLEGLMVAHPETLKPVPKDGKTMGEIFMRGNIVMKGYFKNPQATEEAMKGGWFHTGDLAVWHPDGYIQIQDRSKDIIISGGENISSVEVGDVLYRHPAVSMAAVVAQPHAKWGETPCAFVELKDGRRCTEKELIEFARENLPRFMCPTSVVFGPIPKTNIGKVQKFVLRQRAKDLAKEPAKAAAARL